MRAYLDAGAEERPTAGLDPEGARRAAALEMGSLDSVKEAVRDARAGAFVEGALRAAGRAFRQVRRDVRAVLPAPLPYREPARLQMIWTARGPRTPCDGGVGP